MATGVFFSLPITALVPIGQRVRLPTSCWARVNKSFGNYCWHMRWLDSTVQFTGTHLLIGHQKDEFESVQSFQMVYLFSFVWRSNMAMLQDKLIHARKFKLHINLFTCFWIPFTLLKGSTRHWFDSKCKKCTNPTVVIQNMKYLGRKNILRSIYSKRMPSKNLWKYRR